MLIIYGNELCGYCRKAKNLATQYSIKFEFRNTDDAEVLNQLKKDLPGVMTIPQIWWHGKYIGGYEDFANEVENTRGFGQELF
jgi:glutaredoxin